jgi:hypothetical protein
VIRVAHDSNVGVLIFEGVLQNVSQHGGYVKARLGEPSYTTMTSTSSV